MQTKTKAVVMLMATFVTETINCIMSGLLMKKSRLRTYLVLKKTLTALPVMTRDPKRVSKMGRDGMKRQECMLATPMPIIKKGRMRVETTIVIQKYDWIWDRIPGSSSSSAPDSWMSSLLWNRILTAFLFLPVVLLLSSYGVPEESSS